MAQGSGPLAGDNPDQGPGPTSNITPSFSVPDQGAVWRALGDTFDKITALAQPIINQSAQARGQQMGADAAHGGGERPPIPLGEAGQYLAAGFHAGFMATAHNDIDQRADELATQYPLDPEGYAKAASSAQSGFIQAAPNNLAVDVEDYARQRFAAGHQKVAAATEHHQNQVALNGFQARLDTLRPQITQMAHDGQTGTADFQTRVAEVDGIIDHMVANPAFNLSPEWAAQAKGDLLLDAGSAALAGHVMQTFHAQGIDAALKEMKGLQDNDQLPADVRTKGVSRAAAELNQASAIDREIESNQRAMAAQATKAMQDRVDEDIANVALSGRGDEALKADDVRHVLGAEGVRDWYDKRAKAYQDFRDFGDLSRLSPDQAAQRMFEIGNRNHAFASMPRGVGGDENFDAFAGAIEQFGEHGHAGDVSPRGALGVMQVMPDTGRQMAASLGVPFDADKLKNDPSYGRLLGRAFLRSLLDRYDGDPLLAAAAYNAGPGRVDEWIKRFGDPRSGAVSDVQWATSIPIKETRDYVARVSVGLSGDRSAEAYDLAQTQRRDDPAAAVNGDPYVAAQLKRWQTDLHAGNLYTGTGMAAVQAYMDAQTRAGIKKRDQQPLPNASLDAYANVGAGSYTAVVQSHDPVRIAEWGRNIVRQFNDPQHPDRGYGRRVLQAVLERAGASVMAAQTGAAAMTGAPYDAANSARVDAMHRAANGTTPPAATIPPDAVAALKAEPTALRQQQFDATFGRGASARILHGG